MEKDFKCDHCGNLVVINRYMGTAHRNHCPFCLWSKHVDQRVTGDRKSTCLNLMEPIGLTFKKEGIDKYGKLRQGELMILHLCLGCQKLSLNRIAADDEPKAILGLFEKSLKLSKDLRNKIAEEGIGLLEEEDREEVKTQLFGKR